MFEKPTLSSLLLLITRLFIGFVFVYAGFIKAVEPAENFRGLLAEYTIIPYVLIPLVAFIMPWVELIAGLFLMLGFAARPSALVLSFLSLGFMAVLLLSKWILGFSPASCGCFGEGGIQLTVNQVLFLDLFNCLLGLKLFLTRSHLWSLDGFLSKR